MKGDERIRTAVCAPGADSAYEALANIESHIAENYPETFFSDALAPYHTQSLAWIRAIASEALKEARDA